MTTAQYQRLHSRHRYGQNTGAGDKGFIRDNRALDKRGIEDNSEIIFLISQ